MKYFLTCILMYSALYAMEEPIDPREEICDPDFYTANLVEFDGHIWKPVLYHHYELCPCKQKPKQTLEEWASCPD